MNMPNQAISVERVPSRAARAARRVVAQGCSIGQAFKCAGTVIGCAATCCGGMCLFSPLCIACMGPVYNECQGCF